MVATADAAKAKTMKSRRRFGATPGNSLTQEVTRGVTAGAIGAAAIFLFGGASAMPVTLAVLGGGLLGALIGVLLWCGSDELPDEQVPPAAVGFGERAQGLVERRRQARQARDGPVR